MRLGKQGGNGGKKGHGERNIKRKRARTKESESEIGARREHAETPLLWRGRRGHERKKDSACVALNRSSLPQ